MNTKYQYVYFNSSDANARRRTPDGYNTICVADLEKEENVHVVSYPADWAPTWLRYAFSAHHTPKLKVSLPGKKLWYPHYFHHKFKKDMPICFVISNPELPVDYLRYLKKEYPDCKMVLLHRDLISLFHIRHPEYTEEIIAELFDERYAYDITEAKEYGCHHFDEIESKIDIEKDPNYPLCDVFFAGRVKDRLPKLMAVYNRLTEAGLKCNYYLTGVPQEERIPYEGIEYADRNITYKEMLYRTVNARCVLDINQEGAVGYTSRFIEAVMFNKKLITDNLSIKDSKFCIPEYVCCYSDASEIDPAFVREGCENVDYKYDGEFSPVHLIEQIDRDLCATDERKGE